MNPKRTTRYLYLKLKRLKGNPRSLALGSAIGAFMAVMPIMPVRTVVIIASTAFIRASTLAALIVATIISNPFTYVPLYYCAFITGNAVTPINVDWQRVKSVLDVFGSGDGFRVSMDALLSLSFDTLVLLLFGGLVLAIPVGVIVYVISLAFFENSRKMKGQTGLKPATTSTDGEEASEHD